MKFTKELLGSVLNIEIKDEVVSNDDFIFCVGIIEKFENKYSRFKENNFLSEINKNKHAEIDFELYSLLKLSKKISKSTQGYYDITVLPFLENSGYGISKTKLDEKFGYENIILSEITTDKNKKRYQLELKNDISIELGSIGKGYLIDKVYNYLNKKYSDFIINFGGDIRTKGMYKIYLEDSENTEKTIGSVHLNNNSICSSSGNRRTFNNTHHLISKHKNRNNSNKKALFVTHKLATMSDAFATALFVSPVDVCKKIISTTPGLEAYIVLENGQILKSQGFNIL